MTTTVLVVDDQVLLRAGLRRILESDSRLTVVGEAGDGAEAVEMTRRLRPDVVVMDIPMPKLDGLEATRRITSQHPATRTLILTTFGLDEYVFTALRVGASGFLLKDAPPEDLIAAVHIVARGDALLDPAVTRAVIAEFGPRRSPRGDLTKLLDLLTPREREVLQLLARGLSNAELADRLFVGEGTVKTHVAHVLAKLGLRDRVQAVIFAYEAGVVDSDLEQE